MIPILAEPGSLARGSLNAMKEEIAMVAATGATHYKAQWVSSVDRLVARRQAPDYRQWYELLAWPRAWHDTLRKQCELAGIRYMCTTYLPEDVPAIAEVAQDYLKVASFEAKNRALLEVVETYAHVSRLRPLVSTGMLDQAEVIELLTAHEAVWPLHCVSSYPADEASLNLRVLTTRPFNGCGHRQWGYSDHAAKQSTGALAVAAGAWLVEVHVRLDDAPVHHPDYTTALGPRQFALYVEAIRHAERLLGTGEKAHQPGETFRPYQVEVNAL